MHCREGLRQARVVGFPVVGVVSCPVLFHGLAARLGMRNWCAAKAVVARWLVMVAARICWLVHDCEHLKQACSAKVRLVHIANGFGGRLQGVRWPVIVMVWIRPLVHDYEHLTHPAVGGVVDFRVLFHGLAARLGMRNWCAAKVDV